MKKLPDSPGVYLMKNAEGTIIYVGKAKSLKKRVPAYFQKSREKSPYTKKLAEQINDIEYIETGTEIEALILESNLIKEHQPRYNIVLRDDKSFLYIKVTSDEDFPRISLVRHHEMKQNKNAKYYGPKTSAEKTRKTLKLLKKLFPHKHCGLVIDWLEHGNVRVTNKVLKYPCIDYHIKRCQAPCIGAISPEEYKKTVKKITDFLEGKYGAIIQELKKEMQSTVAEKKFEKAAVIRDKIKAVETTLSRQHVSDPAGQSRDVINFIAYDERIFFNLFLIREGQLIDQENFVFDAKEEQNPEAIMSAFMREYYAQTSNVPAEILAQAEPLDKKLLEKWLKVKITVPKTGKKERLLSLGSKNAHSFARQSHARWERDRDLEKELHSLQKLFAAGKSPAPPAQTKARRGSSARLPGRQTKRDSGARIKRIEAYDISHWGGTLTTGSMVVFENGKPKKSNYRHFRLRTTANKNDDYQSMAEILERRLEKLSETKTPYIIKKAAKNDYAFIKSVRARTKDEDLKKFWIMKDNKKIIGSIGLRKREGDIEEAFGLWVDEAYHEHKLGHVLLRHALSKCPDKKMYIVCSEKLTDYYEQMGFRKVKKMPAFMEKSLQKCREIYEGPVDGFMIEKKILEESFAQKPDLIIIDGGKGQLKAATDVRKKLKLEIPMIALAKKNEEIFLPGQSSPLTIPRDNELSKLFQRIRDEAHRFALNYNKLLRKKSLLE